MEGGCEGRKSRVDSNNNVWAIYKKNGNYADKMVWESWEAK